MVEKLAGKAMEKLKQGGKSGGSGGGALYDDDFDESPFDIIEQQGGLKSMEMKSDSAQWKLKSADNKASKFVAKFLPKYTDNQAWVDELEELL